MAVTPRPASTVVLMDDESRVYLTKRPATMKFMGGFHVFPGGSIENSDSKLNMHLKANESNPSVSPVHYVAAARELFEEVGVLLGTDKGGLPISLSKQKAAYYRKELLDGHISLAHLLEQEGLYLDLNCLAYFGQITTPEASPIRFETRFFLAKLPDGQIPEPDSTEIDEALWILPEEALQALKNKKMRLAPPTILSLQTIINYKKGNPLKMSVTKEELLQLRKKYSSL